MKKKIFTLLTLLLCVCSGAWANQTDLISGITLPDIPTGTYTRGTDVIHKDNKYAVVCDALGNAVMQASAPGYGSPTAANFTWANAYKSSDGDWSTTGDTWDAPTNSVFVGSSAYNTSENAHNVGFSRSCTIRPTRTFAYKFTNCVGVSALVKSASTTDATAAIMAVYKVVGSTHTLIESVSSKTGAVDILTVDGLTTTDTYVAYVYGMHSSGNGFLYEMAFLAPENRPEVELSFSSNSESATVGLNFTEPTLSADPAAQLGLARYSSSNEDVATVNTETGEVTLKTAGSTTISAAIPSNNTSYKSNTASYTLTVAAAPSTGTTVNEAQNGLTYYAVNGDASPSLSSTRTEVTFGNIIKVTGTNMQQGSQDFSIDDANRRSFKVGTGDYVITPVNSSITITAVKLYGYVNKNKKDGKKGQITTGGVAHDLNARDSGAEYLVNFDLVANDKGNYAFSVTAPSTDYNGQDIIVLKVTYSITKSVDVTVSSAGYATLYYGEKLAVPTGVTAYKAAVKDASTITITPIEGTVIPANTGVILKADEGTYNFVVTDEAAGDVTGNILTGTTTATTKEALGGTVFTLGQNSEGVVGLRNYTGTSIRAYSAYTTNVSASRAFYPFSDDETTGINAVDTEAKEINDGVYYNLNGQRVTTPRKGLYIVNGKKVMVK